MDPELLAALSQDPAFADLLNSKQGQTFMSGLQAQTQGAQDWYSTMVEEFAPAVTAGFGLPGGPGTSGGPEGAAMAGNLASYGLQVTDDYVLNKATGKINYKNGVIYDPSTDSILVPPDKAVPGSRIWRNKVLDWSDKQVEKWRDTLVGLGYDVSEKGGVDQEFVSVLEQYHLDRYRNFGKVVPVVSHEERRAEARRAFDITQVDARITNAFRETTGDDPVDKEVAVFRREWLDGYREAARKGFDPDQAAARADADLNEAMQNDPTLSFIAGEQEEEEDGREFFVSVLQALEGLA